MITSSWSDWPTLVWLHVWQIGVLGLAVGGVNLLAGRRWPHLAYALWLVVLLKCFVPPVGIWPVNLLGRLTPAAFTGAAHGAESVEPASPRNRTEIADVANAEPTGVIARPRDVAQYSTHAHGTSSASTTANRFVLLAVWLAGSALLCGIAIGRGSGLGRQLRRSSGPLPHEIQAVVDRVAEQLGLHRGANVLATSTDIGPVVVGLWRPTVYIPDMLLGRMPPQELEAMLAHELAHVRRRDTWVAALQFVAQTIWWFHPVVWWMNRELVRQRERCCDEEAIAHLNGNRKVYARCLVDVLEARQRLEPLWGYPAVRAVELTRRRLEEIMKRKNMTHTRAPIWCWTAAALLALLVVPGGSRPAVADTETSASDVRPAPSANESNSTTAAENERPPTILKYGDGKADGKMSYGDSGHTIRFEMPKGVNKVRGLRIHGSRYGRSRPPDEDFEIEFVSEDLSEVIDSRTAPYRLFRRGDEKWVRVMFDEEVELPPVFWVAINFNAHQTKGVYVSYDTSTKGEYSRKWLPGDEDEPQQTRFHGDWMVQVMLSRPAR